MPVAKFEMPDGRIARFEVPEGTTPEQAQAMIEAELQNIPQAEPVAQDQQDIFPTANPTFSGKSPQVALSVGSDGATKPEAARVRQSGGPALIEPSLTGDIAESGSKFALELITGINRGVIDALDFLGPDQVNAVLQLAGSEKRMPTLSDIEIVKQGTTGGHIPDPTISQLVGAAGEFAAPGLPIGGLAGKSQGALPDLGAVDNALTALAQQSPAKQKIVEKLRADPENTKLVRYMINGAGDAVADPLAKNAIKQGFNDGVVAAVKASSPVDKAKMDKMVKILKRGRENARFAAQNRPADVAGESMLERVKHIKQVNRQAGKRINKEAQALKGQSVDFSAPVNQFMDSLDEIGVSIVRNKAGDVVPSFKGSDIEGSRGAERAIKAIIKRMGSVGAPDAHELHRTKKFIDELVTFGQTKTGLTGRGERILKELRRNLDQTLDNNFPAYKAANDDYSATISALDSFQDAAGRKVDLFGDNADKAIGTSLRRLLSNTQSRANMIDAISEVERVSKKTGAEFSDDIMTQMMFADELDSQFGIVARTSLAGEAEKAVKQGAGVLRGRGFGEAATEALAIGVEKARGINEENAIKAIEEILRRK